MVVGFNQSLELEQGPTGDRHLLAKGIRQIKSGGHTALYDAVSFAAHKLSETEETGSVRRVVIVLSDGEEDSSHVGLTKMIDAALHAEASIFTITYLLSTAALGI